MKAEELMIGDWVCYRGTNIVVTSIYNKGGSNEVGWSEKESVWVNGSNVEPIPLTPEILEKNGFVQDGESWWYMDFRIVLSTSKGVSLVCGRQVKFYYVHQLQQALRLCGIEKEIVL